MNILNFMQRFLDEASCIAYLKEQREQSGIVCKHCGCREHRWDANKLVFECKHCHHKQSLRSGAVLEHSKLPFRYWIAAMFLLTSTKKSFSTEEIRRQLGHKRYQPIWEMVCKLRDVMEKGDERYRLTGSVELDEGFFTVELEEEEKNKPLKRDRGSQRKAKILVMVKVPVLRKLPREEDPIKRSDTSKCRSYPILFFWGGRRQLLRLSKSN